MCPFLIDKRHETYWAQKNDRFAEKSFDVLEMDDASFEEIYDFCDLHKIHRGGGKHERYSIPYVFHAVEMMSDEDLPIVKRLLLVLGPGSFLN
ncbi:hypothetical protein DID80_04525 [Candidatus Marinamargulisbacteria bacterium SCGC AAA071-K20]|nr:hypothetical protein DID80_04525 [Candidatus Marinamargulisbacteria bacterium SCGC AAA071-K20]